MLPELNSENVLVSGLKEGSLKLIKPPVNNSRIVLSKIYKGTIVSEPCNGYAICIAIKGTEDYHLDRDHVQIKEGQYLLLNKNNLFIGNVESSSEIIGLCFRINDYYLQQAYHTVSTPVENLIDDPGAQTYNDIELQQGVQMLNDLPVGRYLNNILKQLDLKNEQLQLDTHELFMELALKLLESQLIINKQINNIAAKKSVTQKELFKRLNKAKSLIFENAAGNIHIPEIAKEIALSESHFFRSFKKAYGITPHQYLLKNKLQKASNLLKHQTKDILEIAFDLGFNDLSTFSRSFKKQFGLAPSEYRKIFFLSNN